MDPRDAREDPFLDTMDALGVDSHEIGGDQDGTGYRLTRFDQTASVFASEGWIAAEDGVKACHELNIDPGAFYAHLQDRIIRGEM